MSGIKEKRASTKLKDRHADALKDLNDAFGTATADAKSKTKIVQAVAKNLSVSSQTVYNYLRGHIKDGFLTEAMTEEFQKVNQQ